MAVNGNNNDLVDVFGDIMSKFFEQSSGMPMHGAGQIMDERTRAEYIQSLKTGTATLNDKTYITEWDLKGKLSVDELKSAIEKKQISQCGSMWSGGKQSKITKKTSNSSQTTVNGKVTDSNSQSSEETVVKKGEEFERKMFMVSIPGKAGFMITLMLRPAPLAIAAPAVPAQAAAAPNAVENKAQVEKQQQAGAPIVPQFANGNAGKITGQIQQPQQAQQPQPQAANGSSQSTATTAPIPAPAKRFYGGRWV